MSATKDIGMLRDAVLLDRDSEPCKTTLKDIECLGDMHKRDWKRSLARMAADGTLVAGHQNFRDLKDATSGSAIPTADLSTIAGTSEVALWPVATYTAFTANQLQPQDVWHIEAYGTLTSAASTPGTLTITPRFGTTTGGTSLGASPASATLTTSQSNVPWYLDLTMTVRAIGLVAVGIVTVTGRFVCNAVAINALNFGGPATAVDTTVAAGIFLGITLGSASDSMIPRSVHLWSEN